MKVTIESGELVIRIAMTTPTPSVKGKTLLVASSHGNQLTNCEVNGYGPITVGVNAYVKAKNKPT